MELFFIIFFSTIMIILFIICVVSIFRNDDCEFFEEFVDGLIEFCDTLIQDE